MERAKELIGKYEKILPKIIPENNTTPGDALKEIISSPSLEDPVSQPTTDLCPKRKKFGDNSSGSSDAPIIISFPLTVRPPILAPRLNHLSLSQLYY